MDIPKIAHIIDSNADGFNLVENEGPMLSLLKLMRKDNQLDWKIEVRYRTGELKLEFVFHAVDDEDKIHHEIPFLVDERLWNKKDEWSLKLKIKE